MGVFRVHNVVEGDKSTDKEEEVKVFDLTGTETFNLAIAEFDVEHVKNKDCTILLKFAKRIFIEIGVLMMLLF